MHLTFLAMGLMTFHFVVIYEPYPQKVWSKFNFHCKMREKTIYTFSFIKCDNFREVKIDAIN